MLTLGFKATAHNHSFPNSVKNHFATIFKTLSIHQGLSGIYHLLRNNFDGILKLEITRSCLYGISSRRGDIL